MSKEFSARMWTTKLNKNRLQNTDYNVKNGRDVNIE